MRPFLWFPLCLLLPCAALAQSGGDAAQKIAAKPWPIPALTADPAGGFAGESRDGILLAAVPPQQPPDGPRAVWFLRGGGTGGEQWQPSGVRTPAWAASTPWGRRVICAGGLDGGSPTARVTVISVEGGKVSAEELAPLPKAVAGGAAAVVGSTLYLFGGASSIDPAVAEKTLWTLALDVPGAAWKQAGTFPGEGRAFCAATAQAGVFCVFGGATVGGARVGARPPRPGFTVRSRSKPRGKRAGGG